LRPFFPRDNDITDVIENTFSTEEERFGELISIPLIPGGENIEVTELNKKEYVEYVPSSSPLPFSLSLPPLAGRLPRRVCNAVSLIRSFRVCVSAITEYRISKRVEEQFQAFMSGFNELIPQELINVFDERELELLIGGMADIDVDDWKKHTDYRGYNPSDEVVGWFWKCVSAWPAERKVRRFLSTPFSVPPFFSPIYTLVSSQLTPLILSPSLVAVPTPPIHDRHVPNPRQRVQGPPRVRRPPSVHHRKGGRGRSAAKESHLL
jgi:hypothetical protein